MKPQILLLLALALIVATGTPALADDPGASQVSKCSDVAVASQTLATPMAKGSGPNKSWQNILDGEIGELGIAGCSCGGTCGLFGTCACTSCTGCSQGDCQSCCTQGCKENCTVEIE